MSNWGGGCCGIHSPLGAVSSFWCVHSFETDKHCKADQLWARLKQGAINREPFTRSTAGQLVDQDTEELKCNQHLILKGVRQGLETF